MESGLVTQALMTTDVNAATDATTAVGGESVEANYGVNLTQDAADFAQSLERAAAPQSTSAVTEAMFAPLDFINNEAKELAAYAQNAIESDNQLTPSEIVTLTTRSQEFMFYSQLTSNVANRTADGLQQLFRQQS